MARDTARVTLVDIARLAGVGVGTASRALSDAPNVSPATRARVREVADRLQYVVSPEASRLAKGTTGRVALVVPHLSRWFFGAVLSGVDAVLKAADLDVLIYQVNDQRERDEFFERLPARRKVDAVVVVGFQVDEVEQKRLELMKVQIVAAGGQSAAYPFVQVDDLAASRQAMKHLVHLGHRRIGMLEAIDPDQPGLPSNRSAGYYAVVEEHHLDVDPGLVVSNRWGANEGAESMSQLLALDQLPTAVFAHSDEVAAGAIRTLRRAGLTPGRDLAIIGIDDHPVADLLDLSTIRQRPDEQGRRAARLLLDLLEHRDTGPVHVTLPTELVVRGSTQPPRQT
jgi:LacI family repressor for deo operon, udp, cdd, tsx, nupC, and nupG